MGGAPPNRQRASPMLPAEELTPARSSPPPGPAVSSAVRAGRLPARAPGPPATWAAAMLCRWATRPLFPPRAPPRARRSGAPGKRKNPRVKPTCPAPHARRGALPGAGHQQPAVDPPPSHAGCSLADRCWHPRPIPEYAVAATAGHRRAHPHGPPAALLWLSGRGGRRPAAVTTGGR